MPQRLLTDLKGVLDPILDQFCPNVQSHAKYVALLLYPFENSLYYMGVNKAVPGKCLYK